MSYLFCCVYVDEPPLDPWALNTWGFLRTESASSRVTCLLLWRDAGADWFILYLSVYLECDTEQYCAWKDCWKGHTVWELWRLDTMWENDDKFMDALGSWRLWSSLFWKDRNVLFPADSRTGWEAAAEHSQLRECPCSPRGIVVCLFYIRRKQPDSTTFTLMRSESKLQSSHGEMFFT